MELTTSPNPWMILPFAVLLAAIALAPLFFADWWQKHHPTVAWSLGALTVAYYLIGLNGRERVWHTAVEYVSFISLIGSLFVPSRYSRRYDGGTFFEEPTLMYVSRGLAGQHPLRFNCRPEVSKLILRIPEQTLSG